MSAWKCARKTCSLEQVKTAKRWAIRILLALLVLVIAAWLLKDTLLKSVAERSLRQATGLELTIGRLKASWLSGNFIMEDFKVFNPPPFDKTAFLHLPEISCAVDFQQMATNRIHFRQIKLHLAELNVTKNKDGLINLQSLKESLMTNAFKNWSRGDYKFGGIDALVLTLQKVNYRDEQQPGKSLQLDLGVNSEVVTNLQSEEDVNRWMSGFLLRMAAEQYLKNPEVRRSGMNFLQDGK